MTVKDLDWFEIHLEDIESPEDFEEAMEKAHIKGFEDGFEAGEEEGYNAGIYSSVVEDRIKEAVQAEYDRIVSIIEKRMNEPEQVLMPFDVASQVALSGVLELIKKD